MLSSCARGEAVEGLLSSYRLLREVEAQARWRAGRRVEDLAVDDEALGAVAELLEPGLTASSLRARLEGAQTRIRSAYETVIDAGTIDALETAADRQRRTSEPFAILLITVPELARIRDAYGSLVYGDYLRDAGALIAAALRDMDRLGRIDESSFLAVMPWMGDEGLPSVSGRLERVLRARDPGLIPEFASVAAGPYGKVEADDLLAIMMGAAVPPIAAG